MGLQPIVNASAAVVETPLPSEPLERQREQRMRKVEKESRQESELLAQVTPDDLLSYGLIPEFVGRLPVTVSLEALDRPVLKRILTEPKNSIVRQFMRLFAMDGVALEFEPATLDIIAREAFARRTGARGLRSIVEESLLDVMYEIPGRVDIVRCVVTPEVITLRQLPLLFGRQGQPVALEVPQRKAA
jgi:ATP-dependent Clp protease ATP-binding subunit ClpX